MKRLYILAAQQGSRLERPRIFSPRVKRFHISTTKWSSRVGRCYILVSKGNSGVSPCLHLFSIYPPLAWSVPTSGFLASSLFGFLASLLFGFLACWLPAGFLAFGFFCLFSFLSFWFLGFLAGFLACWFISFLASYFELLDFSAYHVVGLGF